MQSTNAMDKKLKILFIGNSFTARNDLPGLLGQLTASRERPLEHRVISAGGASLRRHLNAGKALEAIRETSYDYVVLQEQSTLPIKNPKRMHESIRLFDQAIRAAGSKTVLYLTWARRHAPESQQAITDAYVAIGAELGTTVVPVGIAWEQFLREHDRPVLHDRDGSHPTVAGTYLAASVFCAVLLNESPLPLPTPAVGLTLDEAKLLHEAARTATNSA